MAALSIHCYCHCNVRAELFPMFKLLAKERRQKTVKIWNLSIMYEIMQKIQFLDQKIVRKKVRKLLK